MIIADTMVWADFISHGDDRLMDLLNREATLMHPYVRGEISLGNLANRAVILADLDALPKAPIVHHDEVLALIESAQLFGTGVGFVDAHLLASTLLLAEGRLWTRDRCLHGAAERLGIAFPAA
jgi:predicted nucleic acid-binding protein